MITQRELIIQALRRAGQSGVCLTDLAQIDPTLPYRARNHISEMRRENVPIHSERCTVHQHRSAVARYRLLPISEQVRMAL